MRKKNRTGVLLCQQLARLGSGVLLAGILATGSLTLSGYTFAAAISPTAQTLPKAQVLAVPPPGQASLQPPETPAPSSAPVDLYDYTLPVPLSEQVEDSWFADAAFLGDSRTEGLILYGKVKAAGSFAYRGLTVQSARSDNVIKIKDGTKHTAIDALKQGAFTKIYLSLGVNELGWKNDSRYYKNYADLIDLIQAAQPNAQIYLQTLIPVTAAKSASSYINNPQILVYNDIIAKLAEEKEVYLVDVWSAFADKSGSLPAKGSADGVHLTKAYYGKWVNYLKTHTVGGETN